MPKWWKHWLFDNIQAEEAEHTFGVYLGIPEYLYQGEYLEFSIRNAIQVVEFVEKKKPCDRPNSWIAYHLKKAKENNELPFRFWENVVLKSAEMAEIIESLPEESKGDDWWHPRIMF